MYQTFNHVGACTDIAPVRWQKTYILLIFTESLGGVMFAFKNNSAIMWFDISPKHINS